MDNNPLLVKICGLFPSSLASYCHIRTLTDVAHYSIIPHPHYHNNLSSSSSSVHSSSSLNPSSSSSTHVKGPKCPSVSPPRSTRNTTSSTVATASRISSSSNGGSEAQSDSETGRDSFRRKAARKCSRKAGARRTAMSSDQVSTELYYCRGKGPRSRRNARNWRSGEASCYAVEKRTMDPRGEFRASMVEMIVERQMVAEEELERLVLSFLALNSDSYHGMILQVFSEICETLFANC